MLRKNRELRQTSETFLLSAILALSGGFQDAYTYNARDEVFSNAQTGNVVLMSQHLMMGDFKIALRYLFPLIAFALGVLVAERISHRYKNASRIHWRQIVVLVEIVILFAVGFIPVRFNLLATMLAQRNVPSAGLLASSSRLVNRGLLTIQILGHRHMHLLRYVYTLRCSRQLCPPYNRHSRICSFVRFLFSPFRRFGAEAR